jgi:hypothetical protein
MTPKEQYLEQYKKLRELNNGKKPLLTEYYKFIKANGIDGGNYQLRKTFGKDAYSRIQQECGDAPNKLEMVRAPVEKILNQYGELARRNNEVPASADWLEANYTPNPDGLRRIHNLKWVDMPNFFLEHNQDKLEWKDVVEILKGKQTNAVPSKSTKLFNEIVEKIIEWKPDRKRIIEEGYKIELRNYLERHFNLEEETGESNPDLLLNKKYPIEVKKDPTQSEYDRLLGQMIRHNKLFGSAIAVVTSISSEDRFKRFKKLFDEIHEKLGMTAELISK